MAKVKTIRYGRGPLKVVDFHRRGDQAKIVFKSKFEDWLKRTLQLLISSFKRP